MSQLILSETLNIGVTKNTGRNVLGTFRDWDTRYVIRPHKWVILWDQFFAPEGHQALTKFVNEFPQTSLMRYNPNTLIQDWISLGQKTKLAAIVQQSQPLEWVWGGIPKVYFLVDQIADMIIKIRDTSLQHYGKDTTKLIIPF